MNHVDKNAERLQEIFENEGESLRRLALDLAEKDEERSEDLLQASIAWALNTKQQLRPARLREYMKRLAKQKWFADPPLKRHEVNGEHITERDVLESITRQEVLRTLPKELEKLEPYDRTLIQEHFFNGKKIDEIAEERRIPRSTVHLHINRAVEELGNKLDREELRHALELPTFGIALLLERFWRPLWAKVTATTLALGCVAYAVILIGADDATVSGDENLSEQETERSETLREDKGAEGQRNGELTSEMKDPKYGPYNPSDERVDLGGGIVIPSKADLEAHPFDEVILPERVFRPGSKLDNWQADVTHPDAVWARTYPRGKLNREWQYVPYLPVGEQRWGMYRLFNTKDGELRKILFYKNGKKHGPRISRVDGELRLMGWYLEGEEVRGDED